MKKFFIFTIVIVLFWSCSSSSIQDMHSDNPYSQYVKSYKKTDIDSIIHNNDFTIIFGWTEWCQASHNQLKEYLIPFLQDKPANIGVISICCSNSEKLVNFLKEYDFKCSTYLLPNSWSGLDKWRLNRRFHALFDNYKSVNYVPITILCDSKKQILNRDTINEDYHGVGTSILQIKNNFY